MAALSDFVALSLSPIRFRRKIAADLREGLPPRQILHRISIASRQDVNALESRAVALVARAAALDVPIVAWGDARYPPPLAEIIDPPPVIWMKGHAASLTRPAVAIVGSRAGSAYALTVAESLAAGLAAAGLVVVSGLARGVDSAAHRGVLRAGGSTVAVLGSGVDIIYPREHAQLARDITEAGAVISEVGPGMPPQPWLFPLRNRIISGLSRGVIVVEAGEKSGSLITVRSALEQGRDVMAVPGNVLSGRNRGGHALLRDGARIVESVQDVLDEVGWTDKRGAPEKTDSASKGWREDSSATPAGPVIACFAPGESCDVDEITSKTGLPAPQLLPVLLDLELRGVIRRVGGGRFVRFDSSC